MAQQKKNNQAKNQDKKIPQNLSSFLRILSKLLIILGSAIIIINLTSFAKGYFAYLTPLKYEELNNKADKDSLTQTKDSLENTDSVENIISTESESVETLDKVLYTKRPETGDNMGVLYIPKLEVSLPIYEGTNEDELEKGVGHFADSVLPGEEDNCVLSGHRDTVFRKLEDIGEGDSLIVTTSAGEFEYKVKKVRIVDSDDKTVIVPKPTATLTVSTCYPFDYIGPAPKRYILVAYLASKTLTE